MERERTFTWTDPMIGALAAKDMSGFEYLKAMKEGKLAPPPVMEMMDFSIGTFEEGKVSFILTPQEYHYNPIGTVHGGVISTILDSAMACTLHSVLPSGTGYTTMELKVNFLKAISIKTGNLICEGNILSLGRKSALVEAKLLDSEGKLYAFATSTCMILS